VRIVSIVGARPEFVQSVPVSRALQGTHEEILVHTGQHYDYLMSQSFFDELQIAPPAYNLGVGSGSHNQQVAGMLVGLEDVLQRESPDLVLVRGDTNSTLAGALAAAKAHIPTAHIEAGERSFDRRMPEEVNRLVADMLADAHFCASRAAVRHLSDEGIRDSVHWVGDVMLDTLLNFLPRARERSRVLDRLGAQPRDYALVTIHRAANTDDPMRLGRIVEALNRAPETVIFPLHPRTRLALDHLGLNLGTHIRPIDPVGYFDMLVLEENARLIATDSGGVQREAYFMGVPCLTLREETEWGATVTAGWNKLVGTTPEVILEAWTTFQPPAWRPPVYGDGTAAQRIAQILDQQMIPYGARRDRSLTALRSMAWEML
jgi:UDP-N-acetylglucosamine 2-epimerase